jgi:hypothetical protein
MSAKQWRMSPTRYFAVISGSMSPLFITRLMRCAMSRTLYLLPLPTLMALPSADSDSRASRQASATSRTLTKSRHCSPSSKMLGGLSLSRRDAKIARTPVYGFDRAWRVPYTLKKRRATVGMPYASPIMRQSRS